jgi:hypothetical protein
MMSYLKTSFVEPFQTQRDIELQGYLTHKKKHPPRTLPQAYALGHKGVLEGWAFSYGRGAPVNRW